MNTQTTGGGAAGGATTAGGTSSQGGGAAGGATTAGGAAAGGSAATSGGAAGGLPVAGGAAAGGASGGTAGGQAADAGVPSTCVRDDDCRASGLVCDDALRRCVAGNGCNTNSDCQRIDSTDPCFLGGPQCRCDLHDAPLGFSGTCRRRPSVCEPCTTNADCGDDAVIYGPPSGLGAGRCALVGGSTFCLRQRVGTCPCGFVDDGLGFCMPQSNSCAVVACTIDPDCGPGRRCSPPNAGTCAGVCVSR